MLFFAMKSEMLRIHFPVLYTGPHTAAQQPTFHSIQVALRHETYSTHTSNPQRAVSYTKQPTVLRSAATHYAEVLTFYSSAPQKFSFQRSILIMIQKSLPLDKASRFLCLSPHPVSWKAAHFRLF